MKRFFDLTFRPFYVLTGMATALCAVIAFWPRWAVEKILLLPYVEDYTIVAQHWGFLLGLMGVFMVIAAFYVEWRNPILILCGCEKAFIVYLVATHISRPYARGFWGGAAMDAAVTLYTIVYFLVCGFKRTGK